MKSAYRTFASAKRQRPTQRKLPHHSVYARIAPSNIHGVGVFAIRKIRKGASIFPDDDEPIRWFSRRDLGRMPQQIRRLYKDFCIIKDDGKTYGCPRSFNRLTPAWFLNRPKWGEKPNVAATDDYSFYALRDIGVGEELTVDYSTFSEPP